MSLTVSSSIDSMLKTNETYTATAAINDGVIDKTSSRVTGDRTTGLFADSANKLGKEDFLMLLVTQLKFQDPLNPMENTEFIAQLAQFSALESSNNVEKAVNKLDESFQNTVAAQQYSAQALNNAAAISLIGKEVRLRQTDIHWLGKTGETETIHIHLGNNNSAAVQILNSKGEVIRTLEANNKDRENSATVVWDGTTDMGKTAEPGTYTIHIVGEEEKPELYAFVEDVVDGVRFSPQGALVKISGKELAIGYVLDVSSGSTNGQTAGGISPLTAMTLLGKKVRIRQDSVQYNQAPMEHITAYIAAGDRKYVQVSLIDKNGSVVYTVSVPADEDGVARFDWNGIKNDGTYLEKGTYRIAIAGENSDPSLYAFKEGVVDGINNLNGDIRLRIGNMSVGLSSIIDIGQPETGREA